MSNYTGAPHYPHDGSERVGVLLVNHGSPEAPTARHVRPYLRRFLSDTRIIEVPRLLWFLILNCIVLVTRPRRSAKAYASIWTDAGSPMDVLSESLRAALHERLATEYGDRIRIRLGMTYGSPSIEDSMNELRAAGAMQILIVPLYPQYSATTVGAVFDRVAQTLQTWRWVPELRFINEYCDQPQYVQALADSIEDHWTKNGRHDRLMFSFHGIPQSYADAGDPYYCYCHKTARKVAEKLGMNDEDWSLGFQSRLGPSEWLGPYSEDVLDQWQKEGHDEVDIVCPGFAVDCLETLEEIADRLRDRQREAGGELFYIPCLNDSSAHANAIHALIGTHLKGWESTLSPVSVVPPEQKPVAYQA